MLFASFSTVCPSRCQVHVFFRNNRHSSWCCCWRRAGTRNDRIHARQRRRPLGCHGNFGMLQFADASHEHVVTSVLWTRCLRRYWYASVLTAKFPDALSCVGAPCEVFAGCRDGDTVNERHFEPFCRYQSSRPPYHERTQQLSWTLPWERYQRVRVKMLRSTKVQRGKYLTDIITGEGLCSGRKWHNAGIYEPLTSCVCSTTLYFDIEDPRVAG